MGSSAAALLLGEVARADDFLADSRTAQAVRFASPRASLGRCLQALSEATGLKLAVAPALAEQPLTGYVPRRPLRESMQALEELFDAAWSTADGGYLLKPDAARTAATRTSHAALRKKQRSALDAAAAEALRQLRAGALPANRSRQPAFALALWTRLTPVERDRVFQGTPVTLSVPEAPAAELYRVLLSISNREKTPLAGPLLVSFDLDDVTERGLPAIRARATAMRANGVTGGIGIIEITSAAPKPPAAMTPEGAALPVTVGGNGQFSGTREEVLLKLGEAAEVPILSRHRAIPGSAGVTAGGRKLAEVMADLAGAGGLDAVHHSTARGFQLFRSVTEWIDPAGFPPPELVRGYLSQRPPGKAPVPFLKLLPLARFTPLQLAILERSNLCSSEAHAARETYALMHFYLALTPAQQAGLFTPEGIPAADCTHAQLHQLLAGKDKRADWDVEGPLQNPRGLRLRFREQATDEGRSLLAEALRDGAAVETGSADLPVPEAEDAPKASKE